MRLRSSNLPRLVGQRFVVRLADWERTAGFPNCHLLQTLGPINDPRFFISLSFLISTRFCLGASSTASLCQ